MLFTLSHPKRFLLILLFVFFVSFLFLWFSRIPDLQVKAFSDPSDVFNGLLTHDPYFNLNKKDPWWILLGKHILNWLYANYKGMCFGIFLGGAAKSLFRYLHLQKNRGPFSNAFMGLVAGIPLSVCVNCAAPIMKGALASGRKAFALSMMLSSPSMNFIVITMLFSIFPLYLVLPKILFNFIAVLIIIPLITRYVDHPTKTSFPGKEFSKTEENWLEALNQTLKKIFADVSFIFIRTAPLMLLAAIFASILALLFQIYKFQSIPVDWLTLSVVAIIGILLPVPIAIDILLAGAFFSIGMDTNVVLILLYTLGISSIYSLSIIWKALSARWALSIFISLFTLAMAMAPLGKFIEKFYVVKISRHYSGVLNSLMEDIFPSNQKAWDEIEQTPPRSLTDKTTNNYKLISQQKGLSLYARPFQKQKETVSKKFSKLEGWEIGLVKGYDPSPTDILCPFWVGRGIASGDLDQDGWEDLVLGSNEGPWVYKNLGGRFELQTRPPHNINSMMTFFVALVDLNNDNFPELFFTTYFKGNWLVPNHKGTLRYDLMKKIPHGPSSLTLNAAFADFDSNGYLDIANGNTMAIFRLKDKNNSMERQNTISYNNNLQFTQVPLEAYPHGDTNTLVVGDFNRDNLPDLLVGNDFGHHDSLYINKKQSQLELSPLPNYGITNASGVSMSYNYEDMNNDLLEDIFISGSNGSEPDNYAPSEKYMKEKFNRKKCDSIKSVEKRKHCHEFLSLIHTIDNPTSIRYPFHRCSSLEYPALQSACLATLLARLNIYGPLLKPLFPNCNLFPKQYGFLKKNCQLRSKSPSELDRESPFPVADDGGRHSIYKGNPKGHGFKRVLPEKEDQMTYPTATGWSWNSRIFDLDNDGWKDIFLVNGSLVENRNGPNYFLKNENGEKFHVKTFEYNLDDQFNYYSFVPTDFDNDGDLDIIVNSAEGPIRIYKNHHSDKNSLSLNFRSRNGRTFHFTQVILRSEDKQFTGRVNLSGGYLSSCSSQLYFGVGNSKKNFSTTILWPSHEKTDLKHKLEGGYQYLLIKE